MAKSSNMSSTGGVEAWLACFGKHPGWNDHIDEQGLETDRLVSLKRLLYTEGMTTIVDSGVWEAYEDGERLDGIDHTLVWRSAEGLVTTRMWSSRDGKGRAKYPMILCAQTRNAPFAFSRRSVLSTLAELEATCREVETASEVINAVDEARGRLRAAAGEVRPVGPEARDDRNAIARLCEADELGPDRTGLYRLLYQIDRDCGPYLKRGKHDSGTRSKMFDIRPQHLRVPRVESDTGVAMDLWLRVMYTLLDPATPVVLSEAAGTDWIDIVVGDPAPSQFAFLRATTSKVPLTTEIPYTLDDEFLERANELIEQAESGGLEEPDPGFVASARGGAAVGRAIDTLRDQAESARGLPIWVLIGGGVGVLLIVVILVLVASGGGGGGSDASAGPGDSDGPRTASGSDGDGLPAAAPEIPDDVREGFVRWCGAADDWLLRFVTRSDREAFAADPYLSERLLPILDGARDGRIVFDPNELVGRSFGQRRRHADPLPEVLRTRDGQARARASLAALDELNAVLEAWPARATASSLASSFSERGWESPAQVLTALLDGTSPETSEDLNAGILDLMSASAALGGTARLIERVDSARVPLAETGDRVLAGYADLADGTLNELREAASVDELSSRSSALSSLADAADRARATVSGAFQGVDREAFESGAPVHTGFGGTLTSAQLVQWAMQAAEPGYQELDAASDPRLGTRDRLAGLRGRLSELTDRYGADADRRLGSESDGIGFRLDEIDGTLASVSGLVWRHATRDEIERSVSDAERAFSQAGGMLDAVERLLSVGASDAVRFIRSQSGVSSSSPPSLDRAWKAERDRLLDAYDDDSNLRALREGFDHVTSLAQTIDERLSAGAALVASDARRLDAETPGLLEAAVAAARDEAAARAIEDSDWPESVSDASLERAGSWFDTILAETTSVFGGLADARVELADLVPPSEGAAGAVAMFDASSLAGREGFEAAVAGLRDLIRRINGVESVGESVALAGIAADETEPNEVGAAAWTALMATDGVPIDTLAPAAEAQRHRIGSVRDADRRAALEAAFQRDAVGAWVAAAEIASDWDEFDRAVSLARSFGVDRGGVPDLVGYRWAVHDLRGEVRRDADEASGRPVAERALALFSSTGLGASEGVEALASLVAGEEIGPTFDPSQAGPGVLGWVGVANEDATRVEYVSPNEHTLVFIAAPGDGTTDQGVFVQSRETTIGDVIAIVGSRGADWEAIGPLFPGFGDDSGSLEAREGPGGWVWFSPPGGRQRLEVATDWLSRRYASGRDRYYAGGDPAAPSEDSPMQHVGGAAAAAIAARAGCRLPSADEWLRAFDSRESAATPNLRDATWATQRDHQAAFEGDEVSATYPDEAIFAPSSAEIVRGAQAPVAQAMDDGTLWFRPDTGDGNWIGNVAEFVADAWPPAAPGDHAGWTDAARSGSLRLQVIGGSALSPPSIGPRDPVGIPGRHASRSYSDVGFRMAFDAVGAAVPGWSTRLSRVVEVFGFDP